MSCLRFTVDRLKGEKTPQRSLFLMFIYFWERGKNESRGGGRERGRHRIQSRIQALNYQPNMGLEPMNHEIMTWTKVRCLTNWATQAPPQRPCLNRTPRLTWVWLPGAFPGSHREYGEKSLLCFWHMEGKSNHFEICPKHSVSFCFLFKEKFIYFKRERAWG